MNSPQAPSLFGDANADANAGGAIAGPGRPAPVAGAPREGDTLLDLLYDGFYMVFLLKNGYECSDGDEFRERIRSFLAGFERGATRLQTSAEDLYLSKFAFCTLVDEVVLLSRPELREQWERRPLQLELFGEQLGGERFFDHLEKIRHGGAPRLQVIEVHHLCLLLGFQGKYLLDASEKLGYLTARLGEEIAQLKGTRAAFAPHWAAPDRISNALRRDVPLWVIGSVFALFAVSAYAGIRWMLERQTAADLAPYAQIVRLAPEAAHVTITLP